MTERTILRLLLILAICAGGATQVKALVPSKADSCLQLLIAAINYGDASSWDNTSEAAWLASRVSLIAGVPANSVASNNAVVDSMLVINPDLYIVPYFTILRAASDTIAMREWATTFGSGEATFDSMTYRVKSGVDSIRVTMDRFGHPTGRKMTGGQILIPPYWPGSLDGQSRAVFDMRFPRVGDYVMWRIRKHYTDNSSGSRYKGVILDEEGVWSLSGSIVSGQRYGAYPPVVSGQTGSAGDGNWIYGSYTDVEPDYDASWGSYGTIQDSLRRRMDINYRRKLRDSIRANGWVLLPNLDGLTGPRDYNPGQNTDWNDEGKEQVFNWGFGWVGEGAFNAVNYETNGGALKALFLGCRDVKDSAVSLTIWHDRLNPCVQSSFGGWERGQLNYLATILNCEFKGQAKYYHMMQSKKDYVYTEFASKPTLTYECGSQSMNDTVLFFPAQRKYFGNKTATRDTVKGTDGAGQTYMIWKAGFTRVGNDNDTICLSAVRAWVGSNISSTTNISVSLPSGTWFELLANGTYGSPTTGSFNLMNAQGRTWIKDTLLANVGPNLTPSPSLLVDSVHNDAIGELDTLQTRVTAADADSTFVIYSLIGYSSIDSSATSNAIRRASANGVTYTDKFTLTNSETYTLYAKAWSWDAVTGWSAPIQASRTYTAEGAPPVAGESRIKWIRGQ